MNVLDLCFAYLEEDMINDDGLTISDDEEVAQSFVAYPPPDDDSEEEDPTNEDRIYLPSDNEDEDEEFEGIRGIGYHYVHNMVNHKIDKPVVIDNEEYYNRILDIRCDKWDGGMSTEELQAHIVSGLMARGESLSTGINANDLDQNMRDCTGLALESFLVFLDISDAFRTRFNNDKSALLFEPQFKDLVSYSSADGNFKPALNGGVLPPSLQTLHQILLKNGVKSRERREKAEIVKMDRMANPATRRCSMIACNMLLEMMNRICQAKCITSVKWQDIQTAFTQMMTDEKGCIFNKYEPLLSLRKLKSDLGVNMNKNTCRVLFGRGTISKALAHDIYSKIKHEHDGTHLILSFHDPNNPGKDVYQKADFDAIDALIRPPRPPRRYGGVGGGGGLTERQRREERERLEIEERKKTFRMPSISSVYVPSQSHSDHNIFGGIKTKKEEAGKESPNQPNHEEKRSSSPPRTSRDSMEDIFPFEEYRGPRYEGGGFGPITPALEYSDINDSERDPPNNNGDDGLSDSLSSDCERPVLPIEPLFSDDEAEDLRRREEAESYEQMRREKEKRRQNAIARKAEKEANAKSAAAFSSTGDGKILIGANRGRFSQFTAPPPSKSEPDLPNVSKKDQRNFESTGLPNGPVILTPTKARWGVPVEAETVPEKDTRLQKYCVAAAEAEKFSVSEDPRPPINNASVPSTFMEPAVDDSIGPKERKYEPPPTYSTLKFNKRTVPPPPALGSTRHETTINRTNVGVQSNTTGYELCTDPSKLGGLREVFISYVSFHVYCNRSTEGIAVRTWSWISKHLDSSLRVPELYMGREWTDELERAIPNLSVVPIRGDLLFDWNDQPSCAASRRSSVFRF